MRKPVLFYGVNSEGLGHAMRARPTLQALAERYEVHVFCGGRARALLAAAGLRVHPVWHGRIIYRDNTAAVRATVLRSFLEGPWVLLSGAWVTLLAWLLRPVAILTDFEGLTAWAGMLSGTKVISIDNQQVMRRAQLPPPRPQDVRSARVARQVMAWNTPLLHRVLVTSFFQPPLRPDEPAGRTRYVPVAVRPQLLAWRGRTRTDGPVLVYQTSTSNRDLPATLAQAATELGLDFAVYGTSRTGTDAGGRVEYRRFSEEEFLRTLAAAPFLVTNGGHGTIVEALALGKPVLAEPVHEQYEQSVNALGLETLGVGRRTDKLGVADLRTFLEQLPLLRQRAARLDLGDNAGVVRAVEQALAQVNPARALPPREESGPPPACAGA